MHHRSLIGLGLVLSATATLRAQSYVPRELVLKTTDPVPSSGSVAPPMAWGKVLGSAFQSTPASIDANGNVAFWAVLDSTLGGVTAATNGTYWYGGPGTMQLIIRYGDPTLDNANCGGPGAIWTNRQLLSVPMSPSGHMWIGGYQISGGTVVTSGTSANNSVIWSGQSGTMHNLVRLNDVLPGVGGCNVRGNPTSSSADMAMINDAGQVPLSLSLREGTGDATPYNVNTGNNYALCIGTTGSPASVVKIVRWKDAIVGTGTEVGAWDNPIINHEGVVLDRVVLRASVGTIAGAPVTSGNDDLLVLATNGAGGYTPNVIAHEGASTGIGTLNFGSATGLIQTPFSLRGLNNSGRALWVSPLAGAGVTGANDAAMFTRLGVGGTNSLVVREGDVLFGIAPLGSIRESYLSNSNQVAWTGRFAVDGVSITLTNDEFLALSTIDALGGVTHALIAREDGQVPGMDAGVHWSQPHPNRGDTVFGNLAFNARGLISFFGRIAGPGVVQDNPTIGELGTDYAYWLYTPASCGRIRLIGRRGDLSDGIINFATAMSSSRNGEGSTTCLNDENWLSFLVYANGSIADGAIYRSRICPADLSGIIDGDPDGGVDITDLLYFLGQFEAGNCAADIESGANPGWGLPDGGVDINDLLFFLARFEAGC